MSEKMEEIDDLEEFTKSEVVIPEESSDVTLQRIRELIDKISVSTNRLL